MNNETKEMTSRRCEQSTVPASLILKSQAWLAVTAGVYLLALFLVKWNPQWSPILRVVVTLAPLLPGIFYLRSILRSFRAMDELQRRIQIEAWGFALVGTVIVMTAVNVLSAHGLGFVRYPHGLQIGGAYLTMFFGWCAGLFIANCRYR